MTGCSEGNLAQLAIALWPRYAIAPVARPTSQSNAMGFAAPKAIAPVPRTNIPIKRDRTSSKNQHPNANAIDRRPRYANAPQYKC
ncbi:MULTISPECIES: hypothetical protein [unclassified Moorena]|uniref:hypothetical protein n=1 Tax=unclassified Moorena TaxID=2683338 RepID=UPI0013C8BBA6|nr:MULTISPECIES: hypothetical protein [unclassified Moorena]NEO22130.1 hypothetical protein [Moorena sp. SIO4A5]NEP24323.1 hypothetical protein [Moorena sp. SIO3I6]